MDRAQRIMMLSGAILIVAGIGLIVAQMWIEVTQPQHTFAERGATLEGAGTTASVRTTYVGLIVLLIGAFLETVGYVAGRPWKSPQQQDNRPGP